MADDTTRPADDAAPGQEAVPGPGTQDAAQAWRAVVAELDSLGEAIGRWAKAAAGDPENRRRLDELSGRLEGFVSEVGATIRGAADSEVGQSFREAAEKTGEAFRQAGGRLSDEIGPRLSGAFRTAADKLSSAAGRMEDRASGSTQAGPTPTGGPDDGTEGGQGPTSG